jgi:hypothetical protein
LCQLAVPTQAQVTSSDSNLSEREVLAEKLVKMEKYIRKNALQASLGKPWQALARAGQGHLQ